MARAPEVVVVGAGPVGLSLALGLARQGRGVLVLEKEARTAEHSRAPAIWPRTQETLARLGVLDTFLAQGIALPRVELHDADEDRTLLTLPIEELEDETAHPRLLILPQSDTERLLCEALHDEPSAEVRFGAKVVGLEQDASTARVTYLEGGAERTVAAPFVAGCDGARSTVRKAIGATFDGHTYEMRAALADVRLRDDRDLPFPRLTTRGTLAVGIRIDAALWRLILPFHGKDERPLDERVARAVESLFPHARADGAYETVWQSDFSLHRRLSSRFVAGRVALAGDAAHLNSPVAGQGMNSGIHDAEALTAALVRALDAEDPGPLDEYARTRRAAIEKGVNPFTDQLTRALLAAEGKWIRPLVRLADIALRAPPLRRRFLRRLAMLDAEDQGATSRRPRSRTTSGRGTARKG